jgi:hypothetical protein
MRFEDGIGSTQESEAPEASTEQEQEAPEDRDAALAEELEWQVGRIIVIYPSKRNNNCYDAYLRKSVDGYYAQSGDNDETKTELKPENIHSIKVYSGVTTITLKEPAEK